MAPILSMIKPIQADVIVVGAGLVGLAAAIALSLQQKKVVLVSDKALSDADYAFDSHSWDERVYALTPTVEAWLNSIGVWDLINQHRVNPIDSMHIWGADSDLLLSAGDANVAKLGIIIENRVLMAGLLLKLQALDIPVVSDSKCVDIEYRENEVIIHGEPDLQIHAKLILAADGADSWVRQQANIGVDIKKYHQVAVVANLIAEKPHINEAKQWFNPHDILALLPLPNQVVSMVWSVSTERATQLLSLTGSALCEQVKSRSQGLLGELKQIGQIKSATLNQQTANQLIAHRVVLMGDAAHQIHPMAGQGVNLGFRDVMEFTALVTTLQPLHDMGEQQFLRKFERARKADIVSLNCLTSGLDYLFASEQVFLQKLTHWGLQQLARQPTIKKLLIKKAIH